MSFMIIVKNNFKRSLNKRNTFMVNLLLPIIVVVLGILINSIMKPSFTIGVLNSQNNSAAKNAMQALRDTKGVNVAEADPRNIKLDTITGKYSAVVQFNGNTFKIYSVKDNNTIIGLQHLIRGYMINPKPINIETIENYSMDFAKRTVAFIVLFLMITSTVNASLIIKDKANGTFKRYRYSMQNSGTYIAGNMIYNFAITYFQFFISVSMIAILRINIHIHYSDFLLMGIWVAALATAFGTCIATIFNSEMYANLFSACIALVLSLIGGTFIPFEKMPSALQQASVISPLRWFIDVTSFMEKGANWFSNTKGIEVLTAMIFILFLLSIIRNLKSKAE
ncbi:ABC transporter permease [Clostridium neuense]|uniref:ABC transporter permease n=1 Tax=Clostridium neuense TaxID=1728934 RepID=A0ABW8TJ12_9CLOT